MTDDDKSLVERLREGVLYGDARLHNPKGHDPLRMEAADRIEALSAENERLREILREVTPPVHFGESEQNKAWWAKARAALGETE